MKKQITENGAGNKKTSEKLSAIAFEIVDGQAQSANNGAIAKRIAKGQPMKTADALGPDYSVDKRRDARREHTNHFTNRAPTDSK